MAVSKEDILETISNMSVMDVVDLISAMEEKFGVSAAAPVAVAAGPAAEMTDSFDRFLGRLDRLLDRLEGLVPEAQGPVDWSAGSALRWRATPAPRACAR